MKRTDEDLKIASMLKQGQKPVGENQWFTPRVLNRLPEKQRGFSFGLTLLIVVAMVLAITVCSLLWGSFVVNQNLSVITVRDVLQFGALVVVTIGLMSTGVHYALKD